MQYLGRGRAKLLLFGEHAAVYGFPALGLPLPLTLTASICPGNGTSANQKLETLVEMLLHSFPGMEALRPFHLRIESEIPSGAGLGSSAALCTALVRAASSILKLSPENTPLSDWKAAHAFETLFHGKPSGIDTGICIHETLCAFRPGSTPLPECTRLDPISLPLIVGALPRKSSTSALIAKLKSTLETGPAAYKTLEALGQISAEAIQVISQKNRDYIPALAEKANRAHESLKALELSTSEIDRILDYGMQCGALGGKLSGAGDGGAYYLLAGSPEEASRIVHELHAWLDTERIPHLLKPRYWV